MKIPLPARLALLSLALFSLSCKTVTRLLEEETPAPPTPVPAVQVAPPTRIPATVTPASACPNGDCIAACVASLDNLTLAEKPGSPSMRLSIVFPVQTTDGRNSLRTCRSHPPAPPGAPTAPRDKFAIQPSVPKENLNPFQYHAPAQTPGRAAGGAGDEFPESE